MESGRRRSGEGTSLSTNHGGGRGSDDGVGRGTGQASPGWRGWGHSSRTFGTSPPPPSCHLPFAPLETPLLLLCCLLSHLALLSQLSHLSSVYNMEEIWPLSLWCGGGGGGGRPVEAILTFFLPFLPSHLPALSLVGMTSLLEKA